MEKMRCPFLTICQFGNSLYDFTGYFRNYYQASLYSNACTKKSLKGDTFQEHKLNHGTLKYSIIVFGYMHSQ